MEKNEEFNGRWVHCSPELLQSGISCVDTPRRPCQCGKNGSHDHFVTTTQRDSGIERFQHGDLVVVLGGPGTGIVQGLTNSAIGLPRVLVKWDGSGITAETHPFTDKPCH